MQVVTELINAAIFIFFLIDEGGGYAV